MRVRYQSRWAKMRSSRALFLSLGTGIARQMGFSGSSRIGSATSPGSCSSSRAISQTPPSFTLARSDGFASGSWKTTFAAASSAASRPASPGLNFELG